MCSSSRKIDLCPQYSFLQLTVKLFFWFPFELEKLVFPLVDTFCKRRQFVSLPHSMSMSTSKSDGDDVTGGDSKSLIVDPVKFLR